MQTIDKSQSESVILVLNSGSSSLKFSLYYHGTKDEELILEGRAEAIGRDDGTFRIKLADGTKLVDEKNVNQSQPDALLKVAALMREKLHVVPVAVAHRIVNGGPNLLKHQLATDEAIAELTRCVHFAPVHTPAALSVVHEAKKIFSACPHFLCFDTAFHSTMPEVAKHLPIPTRYYDQGIIRYGAHGLSFESLVYALGTELPKRAVFAHLGNGSSITAVLDGKSIDTSMGLTPTGGVPMGTRTGDLDPGVVIYLMRNEHLNADQMQELLNGECGLTAFSNGESDMQVITTRAKAGDAAALFAIDAFSTAIRKWIGSYAALMGGIDLLVFSGGIGENSVEVRTAVCDGLQFLGIDLNAPNGNVRVVKTEEERQIARHGRALLKA
ncbi:MAG TPA: acetate/propionate family kinase [Acidobacteriaceae bacterium]